jgi:formylglycine-generating enzyme required for sulfatase activity
MKLWTITAILILELFSPVFVFSQEIRNVQFKLDGPNKEVLITYDLYDLQERVNEVIVQASNDQGKNWNILPAPQALSGDLNEVRPGKGKSVVWKAGDDFQGFSPELFQVRLVLAQVVSSASSAVTGLDPAAEADREARAVEKENELELNRSKNLLQTLRGKEGTPMILIPAGYFTMGSPKGKGNDDEHPAHKVWISAFYIDQTLVTFDEYDKFCDATGRQKPSDGFISYSFKIQSPHWGRAKRPALNLSWKEAEDYCQWAGERLPTEAEWEKAARGGTDSAFFWGSDAGKATDYAWYVLNSRYEIWPVGTLKPNPYGLYDMAGNLWEWVSDWYSRDYYATSPDRNPAGPPDGKLKVLRGGSFSNGDDCLQTAHRSNWDPDKEDGAEMMGHLHEHGCRCVKPAEP